MTPTQEETLQAELEALKASLPEVARKARDEALEEAARVATAEAERIGNEQVRGAAVEWVARAISALKSKP